MNPKVVHHTIPDRMYLRVDAPEPECHEMSLHAVAVARRNAPKMTGNSARSIEPIWGQGWFGVRWDPQSPIWFNERGTRPFTMRSLAGKTIPMWIDDPVGTERRANPKARVRTTASGKVQVLIFRRAAKLGERRMKRDRHGKLVDVPASYPGAPGRIAHRDAAAPWTAAGRRGGSIRPGNVGVRWRHPGIHRRGFIRFALQSAASAYGFDANGLRTATRPQPWMTKA